MAIQPVLRHSITASLRSSVGLGGLDFFSYFKRIGAIVASDAEASDREVQQPWVLSLDGVNDYVSTTTAPITGELTAWVKTTDDNGCVIGSQAGANRCYLQIRSGVLGGGLGSVSYVTMFGTITVNDGAWHLISMTWDGSNTRLYVDGVLDGTYAQSGTVEQTLPLYIGGLNSNTSFAAPLTFDASGVNMTSAEYCLNHVSGTIAYDSSGSDNHGTLVNGASWVVDATLPPAADVANLEGYSEYGIHTELANSYRSYTPVTTDAETIEIKFYLPNDIVAGVTAGHCLGDNNNTANQASITLGSDTGTYTDEIITVRSGTAPTTQCVRGGTIAAGWHTLRLEYGTADYDIILDGVSQSFSKTGTVTIHPCDVIRIGLNRASAKPFMSGGVIEYYKVWDSGATLFFHVESKANDGSYNEITQNLTPTTGIGGSGTLQTFIPIDESDTTMDVLARTPDWSGSAFPRRPVYRGSYGISPDGSNDYVTTGIIPSSSGSIEVTFRKGTSTNKFLFGARDSANTRAYVGYDTAKKPTGGVGAQSGLTIIGTTVMVVGAVYKTMLSWTGSVVTLNLDDVTEYTGAQSGVVGTVQDMYIGTFNDAGTPFATGYVNDEIFEIKVNGVTRYTCAEGVGTTLHDVLGTHDGTITNASTATEGAGFWAGRIDGEANAHNINNGFSRRMLFDGVNDYVSFDLGTFNTSAWSVKATFAFNDLSSNQDIFSQAAGSGTGRAWVRIGTNGNATTFLGGAGSTVIAPSSTFSVGGVYVIELVYSLSPDTLTLIVDGVSQSPVSRTVEESTGLFYIGVGHGGSANPLNGTAYNATLNGSTYTGNGNTDADWTDQIGSNNGTVNSSPALLRVPADSSAPTLDVYGDALTNPPITNGYNNSETTLDVYNIAEGDNPSAATANLSNFSAIAFSDTSTNLTFDTTPIDAVFRRDESATQKDRLLAFSDSLSGTPLRLALNYTEVIGGAPWDDTEAWIDSEEWVG